MIDRFVLGLDQSTNFAKDLEQILGDAYPDEEVVQDLVDALAQYSPGGGDHLYNENDIVKLCQRVLKKFATE
jgi:hypothetical protein